MTNNTIGIFGFPFWEWLDQPEAKFNIVKSLSWYNPKEKLNVESLHAQYKLLQIWFCAGSFCVLLREPYLKFNYPGSSTYKMMHEDQILSYFYQHHGYRMGNLQAIENKTDLDVKNYYACLGNRIIMNDGLRSFDMSTVEEKEHSIEHKIDETIKTYKNKWLNI